MTTKDSYLRAKTSTVDEIVRQFVSERSKAWARAASLAAEEAVGELATACEYVRSPIEEIFLCAIWCSIGWGERNIRILDRDGCPVAWNFARCPDGFLIIQPQADVGRYRADFLIERHWAPQDLRARVVVELDGHDFHEKTKRQAAHDKKRDRFFASEGLTVLRFTGSEIHKDVDLCVGEVQQFLSNALRKQGGG